MPPVCVNDEEILDRCVGKLRRRTARQVRQDVVPELCFDLVDEIGISHL
jgi:hypothetical protein